MGTPQVASTHGLATELRQLERGRRTLISSQTSSMCSLMGMRSMSDRLVIVGMNNPHSERPDAALLPHPRGVAGHRLWKMLHDVCGMSRHEYCLRTERVNLVNATSWDHSAGAEAAGPLWRALEGRRALVLGATARALLWLPASSLGDWSVCRGVRWASIAHPSGLCRQYNDPMYRLAVGLMLEDAICR